LVIHEIPRCELELGARWYAPLIAPRQQAVRRVLDRLDGAESLSVGALPRAGLASAWLLGVVSTYGRPRMRRAVTAGAQAAERYNLGQFQGILDLAERQRAAREQFGALRGLGRSLLDHDREHALAVLHNWQARPLEAPQPESVLFLRALTGWAAVAGRIPGELHARLDRVADALGWLAEAHLSEDAEEAPCFEALADLPHSAFVEEVEACLSAVPALRQPRQPRQLSRWQPRTPPSIEAGRGSTLLGEDAPAVEVALRQIVDDGLYVDVGRWLLDRGGKRVRPALCLAAAQACGGPRQAAVPAAALVEWLHQASLVLDDVMDGSEVRRGAPTLHVATDVGSALGAFCWLLERLYTAAEGQPEAVREALLDGARQLIEGQYEELCQTGVVWLDLRTYHRILAGKTAALFGVAATVGALSVGASKREVAAVAEFARCVGLAFQIIDDLLDYTGSLDGFGKAPGVDLCAHKITLPVMLLRGELTGPDRARLDALLHERVADEADLDWVRAQLEAHDIVPAVQAAARAHLERSERALRRLPADADVRALRALAARCVERSR